MNASSFRPLRSKIILSSLIIVAILTFSGLMAPQTSAAASDVEWDIKTIDGSGGFTSIDVGPNGSVHISYCDSNNNDLKYACMAADGSSWTIGTVDNGTTAYSSIAVAADGSVHISYFDDSNGDLKYATSASDASSWTIETVDSSGDVGRYPSIAVTADGSVHISYYDQSNGDLKYATRASDASSWTIETVDSSGDVGSYSSIVVPADGSVHISYYDDSNDDLKYAARAPEQTSWTVETADNWNRVGKFSSLAVDVDGNVHISYHDYTNSDIRYASKPVGGSWFTEKVGDTSMGYKDEGPSSLALDADGNVHVSYTSSGGEIIFNYGLSYAVKEAWGAWSTVPVDTPGVCGQYNSIALGSGNVYISYYQGTDPGRSVKCAIGELPWAPTFLNAPLNGLVTNGYEHSPQFDEEVEITYHYTDAPFLSWNGSAFVGTPGADDAGNYDIIITAKSVEGRLSATQTSSISIAPMPVSLRINSDWEMENAVISHGLDGNGSAEDPYIITGFDIDSHDAYENSLFIGNVTHHFQVLGNRLGNTSSTYAWDEGEVAALYLYNCRNAVVRSNHIDDSLTGIRLYECPGAMIDGNIISGAGTDGILVTEGCNGTVISGNGIIGGTHSTGISVFSSGELTVAGNHVDCEYGIYAEYSDRDVIDGNNLGSCSNTGVWLVVTGNSTVSNNNCSGAMYGIRLSESANNTVSDNLCINDGQTAIYLDISRDNNIIGNNCSGAMTGIQLTESVNNTVSDNVCRDNLIYGIHLDYSDNNTVSGNDCLGNLQIGIILDGSGWNAVKDNLIHYNYFSGLYMYQANNNTVSGNDYVGSNLGINFIGSNGNLITDNRFEANYNGMVLVNSQSNTLSFNLVMNSIDYGLIVPQSDGVPTQDNVIFGNHFIGNRGAASIHNSSHVQVSDSGDNVWHQGDVGNIWSDWSSPDDDADGIVDRPYLIDGGINSDPCPQAFALNITTTTVLTNETFFSISGTASSYGGMTSLTWYNAANGMSGAIAIDGTWTASVTLAPGNNLITVNMTGGGGNLSASMNVFCDPEAPAIVIVSPVNATYDSDGVISLEWSASDDGSGIVGCIVSVYDGSSWANTTYGPSETETILNLADEIYAVSLTVTDLAGNWNRTVVTFTVDTAAPSLEIIAPEGGSYNSTGNVTVTWVADDAMAGIDRYTVSDDGIEWTVADGLQHTFVLSDGVHILYVRAYDMAGNFNETNVTVIVDMTVPTLEIASPADGAPLGSSLVGIVWTADDDRGIAHFLIRVDGGSWTYVGVGNLSWSIDMLLDGEHTVAVEVIDLAGNRFTDEVTFVVDTAVPEISITSPAGGSYNNNGSVTVTWNGSDATTGIDRYAYSTDGSTWTNSTELNRTFSLTDGEHTVHVRAYDMAGNFDQTGVVFIVDTAVPEISITSPAGGSYNANGNVTVTWEGSDATSGIDRFAYGIDGTTWTVTDDPNRTFSFADGTHTVYVRAYDSAGNFNQTNVTFIVDTVAPTATVSPTGEDVALNATITVIFSEAMDADGTQMTVSGVGGSIIWNGSTATFTPSSLAYNGEYTVNVSGRDMAGNVMAMSWNFSTIEVGFVTGTLVDAEGNVQVNRTVRLSNGMTAVTGHDGVFRFDNVTIGTYELTVDGDGYGDKVIDVTVIADDTTDLGGIEAEADGEDGTSWIGIAALVIIIVLAVGAVMFLRARVRK